MSPRTAYRVHCRYTIPEQKTIICKVCGHPYTYPMVPNQPVQLRDTCDDCCSKEARRHRSSYTRAIEDALYLTDTSAVLLVSCLEDPRHPMTIKDVADLTNKDARDWQAFYNYLVQTGEYSRLAHMERSAWS